MTEIIDGRITGTTDGHYPQYFVGLEASKPTNPAVGDKYAAYDTGKEYVCNVVNVWSLVNSSCYDEYSNHNGTVDNLMSLEVTGNGSGLTDNYNHMMVLDTGLIGSAKYYGKNIINPAVNNYELNFKVQNISLDDGAVFIGLINNLDNGVYFWVDKAVDSSWVCVKSDSISQMSSSAGTISNGDILTIIGRDRYTIFMVNGSIVATIDYNIENTYCNPSVKITSPSNVNEISTDLISWRNFK
jgi:hypothetical protein